MIIWKNHQYVLHTTLSLSIVDELYSSIGSPTFTEVKVKEKEIYM